MTFEEYTTLALSEFLADLPAVRIGQSWFNTLDRTRPDLSNMIRGRALLDPFYNDCTLTNFLDFLAVNW